MQVTQRKRCQTRARPRKIACVYGARVSGRTVQVFDAETGLFQNWHRTYNARLGRYLESDPIGLEGGINTYSYVGGNPLKYVDVLGLSAQDINIMLDQLNKRFPEYSPNGGYIFKQPEPGNIAQTDPWTGEMHFDPAWAGSGCLSLDDYWTRITSVFHEGMHSTDSFPKRILDGLSTGHGTPQDPIWNRERWEFGSLPDRIKKRPTNMWGKPGKSPVDVNAMYQEYLEKNPDCNCRR